MVHIVRTDNYDTTSSDDVQMLNVNVSLFPNPVEDLFNAIFRVYTFF
ncbi:MAG: hypothetical protein IPJ39_19660 [Saprospiraceae bacterium]|nr:hypothetical protein [Saprospiraceae bacterium]